MSDAREMLRWFDHNDTCGSVLSPGDNYPCSCDAGLMAEALRAVLDLHERSVSAAGTLDGTRNGDCIHCQRGRGEPLRVYRDHLNGEARKTWMHDHEDPWPVCWTCAAGYEGRADWPCPTVQAITSALAGDPR